jgi:large subunit ribosomal protein L37Ae
MYATTVGASTMANQGSTGSAGRFGARYGRVSRRRVSDIEGTMNDDHTCPDCGSEAVSRKGTGIWQCGKCDYKYAGGAYQPQTPSGKTVQRSIRTALGESAEDDE